MKLSEELLRYKGLGVNLINVLHAERARISNHNELTVVIELLINEQLRTCRFFYFLFFKRLKDAKKNLI